MHKLSPLDSGFLLTESHHSPRHVGGVQILKLPKGKGSVWLRTILENIKQVPPGFPFNQKLRDDSVLSPTLVTDEYFDIEYHVRHTVLPGPGSHEQLLEMVSRLHANLLDRERPLWEFHLIEGLSKRRFAFYTKVHHSLVDGVTFARWFSESGSEFPEELNSRPIWQRDEQPRTENDGDSISQLLVDGVKMLGGSVKTAVDLTALSTKLIQKRIFDKNSSAALPLAAPRTRLNVPTGAARNFSTTHHPLEEIKTISKSQGVSVNDLVMALCDLAMNRYFREKGEEPAEPLVAYMPVNLRKGGEDNTNLISLLQVKLASDHEHPLTTLAQISKSSRSTRDVYDSTSNPAIQIYSLVVALLPLGSEILKLDQLMPPAINLVISNVPGPEQKMYFRGAEVVAVYPVNLLPPSVALSMTVCSYAGNLFFGLVSGRTAIPDLQRLTDYLDEAFEEFKTLIGNPKKDRPR